MGRTAPEISFPVSTCFTLWGEERFPITQNFLEAYAASWGLVKRTNPTDGTTGSAAKRIHFNLILKKLLKIKQETRHKEVPWDCNDQKRRLSVTIPSRPKSKAAVGKRSNLLIQVCPEVIKSFRADKLEKSLYSFSFSMQNRSSPHVFKSIKLLLPQASLSF